jgi:Fic family protein
MQTFRQLDEHLGALPAAQVNALAGVEVARGQQEMYRRQNPQALKTLQRVAMIQSTEASNAIEGVTAPPARIQALVEEKTKPENRSEAEIAGYRDVLAQIHASANAIPMTANVVRQLHRDLFALTDKAGGSWKIGENRVTETHPNGTVVVRFAPVSAAETPRAMDELHLRFSDAWNAARYHKLLLIAAYVLDFLVVHPFQDGNGRMSRLVTTLMLYHANYEVGRFISIEKLINDSRETYYESLQRSTAGWHDGEHDLQPWLSYFLGTLIAASKELERRLGAIGGRGSKQQLVLDFVRSNLADTFSIEDVRRAAPGVSDIHIAKILRSLKEGPNPALESHGRGRSAYWRRRHQDF